MTLSKSKYIRENYKNLSSLEFAQYYGFKDLRSCKDAMKDVINYLLGDPKTDNLTASFLLKWVHEKLETDFDSAETVKYFRDQNMKESAKRKATAQFCYEMEAAEGLFDEGCKKMRTSEGGQSSAKITDQSSENSTDQASENSAEENTTEHVQPVEIRHQTDSSSLVPVTVSEFRCQVYAYGVKALNKSFSLYDAVDLRKLVDEFQPTTMAQQLDMCSAQIILKNELTDTKYLNALKLSLSHIVDKVNDTTLPIYHEYIKNQDFWEKFDEFKPMTLTGGMTKESKEIYNSIMKDSQDTDGKVNKKAVRLEASKKKTSLLVSNELKGVEIVDIIDTAVKNCIDDSTQTPNPDESELTCYRNFMKILDDVFDSTQMDLIDGEITCKATKSVAKIQEQIFSSTIPLNKGFGRRIDLILATKKNELSTSEWKRKSIPISKSIQQQVKNLRNNKAILTKLLELPVNPTSATNMAVVGMDWTGPLGYLFGIQKKDDIFFATRLSTLVIPTYLSELPEFIETLDELYKWRDHHLSLRNIVLPAVRKLEREQFFSAVLGKVQSTNFQSPNIYLTPTKKRPQKESLYLSEAEEEV